MPKAAKSKPMLKWRPAPEQLVRLFDRAIRFIPEAQVRKTFGYPSATINGHMFTGLHQDRMILRLGAEDRAQLAKLGAQPFEPMPGRPMKEYLVIPESVLKSDDLLEIWLKKAFAYCISLPPKPAKTAKKKSITK